MSGTIYKSPIAKTAKKRRDALMNKAAAGSLSEAMAPYKGTPYEKVPPMSDDAKAIQTRVQAEQIPEAEIRRGVGIKKGNGY